MIFSSLVFLVLLAGGQAVHLAMQQAGRLGRVDEARDRLAAVRTLDDIPRYLAPARGIASAMFHQAPREPRSPP